MTFYSIGTRLIEENLETMVCEWEADEEESIDNKYNSAELISITNRTDTKSYEQVNLIVGNETLTYKLGDHRTLGSFQAVWFTRNSMPI